MARRIYTIRDGGVIERKRLSSRLTHDEVLKRLRDLGGSLSKRRLLDIERGHGTVRVFEDTLVLLSRALECPVEALGAERFPPILCDAPDDQQDENGGGFRDPSIRLDSVFRDVERHSAFDRISFYQELLDHLRRCASDERTLAYLNYYELALRSRCATTNCLRNSIASEYEAMLQSSTARRDPVLRCHLYERLGTYQYGARTFDDARRSFERALIAARCACLPEESARVLVRLAMVEAELGDIDRALDIFDDARANAASVLDNAECLNERARLLHACGRFEESERSYIESLELQETAPRARDAERISALTDYGIGDLYLDWHRLSDAMKSLCRARETFRSVLAHSRSTAEDRADFAMVESAFARAKSESDAFDGIRILRATLVAFNEIYFAERDTVPIIIYRELARSLANLNDDDAAIEVLETAVRFDAPCSNPYALWEAKIWLADLRLRRRDGDYASAVIGEVTPALDERNRRHLYTLAQLLCLKGRMAFESRQWESGIEAYRSGCRVARRWNPIYLRHRICDLVKRQIRDLFRDGNAPLATRFVESLQREADLITSLTPNILPFDASSMR